MDFLLLTCVSCKYLVALWWLQQATLRLKLEPGSLVMIATQIMEDFLGKDKIQSLQVGFTELDGFAPGDKSNPRLASSVVQKKQGLPLPRLLKLR